MSQVADKFRLVRLYSNGDGKNGGVKFFLSTKQASWYAIRPGDLFKLHRNGDGALELVPLRAATPKPVPTTVTAEPRPRLFERRPRAEAA